MKTYATMRKKPKSKEDDELTDEKNVLDELVRMAGEKLDVIDEDDIKNVLGHQPSEEEMQELKKALSEKDIKIFVPELVEKELDEDFEEIEEEELEDEALDDKVIEEPTIEDVAVELSPDIMVEDSVRAYLKRDRKSRTVII